MQKGRHQAPRDSRISIEMNGYRKNATPKRAALKAACANSGGAVEPHPAVAAARRENGGTLTGRDARLDEVAQGEDDAAHGPRDEVLRPTTAANPQRESG